MSEDSKLSQKNDRVPLPSPRTTRIEDEERTDGQVEATLAAGYAIKGGEPPINVATRLSRLGWKPTACVEIIRGAMQHAGCSITDILAITQKFKEVYSPEVVARAIEKSAEKISLRAAIAECKTQTVIAECECLMQSGLEGAKGKFQWRYEILPHETRRFEDRCPCCGSVLNVQIAGADWNNEYAREAGRDDLQSSLKWLYGMLAWMFIFAGGVMYGNYLHDGKGIVICALLFFASVWQAVSAIRAVRRARKRMTTSDAGPSVRIDLTILNGRHALAPHHFVRRVLPVGS